MSSTSEQTLEQRLAGISSTSDKVVIALDRWAQPIFVKESFKLPWQIDTTTQLPLIKGKKILLQCIPCLYFCDLCDMGYILVVQNATAKNCKKGDICPSGFIKSLDENNRPVCRKMDNSNLISIAAIKLPTLTVLGE